MTTPTMTMTTEHEADAALLEAVAESIDRTLLSHSRVSSAVSGDGIVVAHQVQFHGAGGSPESHLIYVETSQRTEQRDGVLTLRDEDTGDQVSVWVYPRDPALPALPAAVYPDGAALILRRLGLETGNDVALKLEAYRPGRRAVIRVDTDRHTVFLKVVSPGAAGVLAQRHNAWLGAGLPVPRVLGWSDEGLLALSALEGTPAVDAVARLAPARFATEILSLQTRIATVPSTTDARTSLSARLDWYARRLTRMHPGLAAPIGETAARIRSVLERAGAPAPVTVHGDLHVGQLFLGATDAITGVLDIDTAGLGDSADDAGALYAHLIVTAALNAARPEIALGCAALAENWRANWRRDDDPGFIDRATAIAATHLLAHGLGHSLDAGTLVDRAAALVAGSED